MKGWIPALLLFGLISLPAHAQNKGDEPKTADKNPYKNKVDMVKEFKKINGQAERKIKGTKTFTAKWKLKGKAKAQGSMKAKYMKGKMWGLLDEPEAGTQKNIAGKKITTLWPKTKEYTRIDYKKVRDDYPIGIFFVLQYRPSKLDDDYVIKPVRLALKYKKSSNKDADKYKGDDPFSKKAKDFENGGPSDGNTGSGGGPDANTHHVVELIPKSKKLGEKYESVTLYVHYKTFTLSMIEMKPRGKGAVSIKAYLSDYKLGPKLKSSEVLIKTLGWSPKR